MKIIKTRVVPLDYENASVGYVIRNQGKPFALQERRYFLGIFPYWKTIDLLDQKPD